MAKFMVVRKLPNGGKQILMQTDEENCIYPDEIILDMMQAGCTAYLDGKIYKPKKGNKQYV